MTNNSLILPPKYDFDRVRTMEDLRLNQTYHRVFDEENVLHSKMTLRDFDMKQLLMGKGVFDPDFCTFGIGNYRLSFSYKSIFTGWLILYKTEDIAKEIGAFNRTRKMIIND